eukprot:scaffold23600_cov120-Isochrysis_galbana.AAC.3
MCAHGRHRGGSVYAAPSSVRAERIRPECDDWGWQLTCRHSLPTRMCYSGQYTSHPHPSTYNGHLIRPGL